MKNKAKIERLKITANVWAMLSVAAFASVFFERTGLLGCLVGVTSFILGILFTNKWAALEEKDG